MASQRWLTTQIDVCFNDTSIHDVAISIAALQSGSIVQEGVHGVIPGSSQTKAQGISSPGTYEAILMWPLNDGERQWIIMLDWMCR